MVLTQLLRATSRYVYQVASHCTLIHRITGNSLFSYISRSLAAATRKLLSSFSLVCSGLHTLERRKKMKNKAKPQCQNITISKYQKTQANSKNDSGSQHSSAWRGYGCCQTVSLMPVVNMNAVARLSRSWGSKSPPLQN